MDSYDPRNPCFEPDYSDEELEALYEYEINQEIDYEREERDED